MTSPGALYCELCWDFYNRVIYPHYQKLAPSVLNAFLHQRKDGDKAAGKPPLHTAATRKAAKLSGQPFCPICYSLAVTRVTAENQALIKANLPVNGLQPVA